MFVFLENCPVTILKSGEKLKVVSWTYIRMWIYFVNLRIFSHLVSRRPSGAQIDEKVAIQAQDGSACG